MTLWRWTCLYWVGKSSLPTYSVLLIYLVFGRLLDVGVALAAIIVAKATPTFPMLDKAVNRLSLCLLIPCRQ